MSNAIPMVIRCYYHQHPEDYGRGYAAEGVVPTELLNRGDAMPASEAVIHEEIMGHPGAVPV